MEDKIQLQASPSRLSRGLWFDAILIYVHVVSINITTECNLFKKKEWKQVNKKHEKWKSSRIGLEKSKETRGYLQTGVVKNPTPLHEEYNPQSISYDYPSTQTATA